MNRSNGTDGADYFLQPRIRFTHGSFWYPVHPVAEALDGDGCYKKIADVLKYILSINSVSDLLLKDQQRTICARFAADGRKTSAKIGSVMSVISLVDKDHHYTIALYNVEDCPIERFITECSSLSTKKTTKERKGCIAEPLVPIPLNSVVIDTLHLFLRIMGLLFHQVVDKVLAYQEENNLIKEMKLAGVPFMFFKVQGEGETTITKFTKLDGQDLKKVLYNLNVKAVLERIPTVSL
ncbi:hypothetical protein AC249_AIPGENE24941 [Exaiptasia diaphana]|nr:hypothetical protein AC249_AIPGENE24941 [Exaiptasia diaphana]